MRHQHVGEHLVMCGSLIEAKVVTLPRLDPLNVVRSARASREALFRAAVFAYIDFARLIASGVPWDSGGPEIASWRHRIGICRDAGRSVRGRGFLFDGGI